MLRLITSKPRQEIIIILIIFGILLYIVNHFINPFLLIICCVKLKFHLFTRLSLSTKKNLLKWYIKLKIVAELSQEVTQVFFWALYQIIIFKALITIEFQFRGIKVPNLQIHEKRLVYPNCCNLIPKVLLWLKLISC